MQWTTTGDRITLPYVAPEDDLQSTPATIKALAEAVVAELELATPVGAILPYMGDVAPDGWLICDGSQYDPSDLPELYAVNNAFHASHPEFRVPDMRGRAPFGTAEGAGFAPRDWTGDSTYMAMELGLGDRTGDWKLQSHWHGIGDGTGANDGNACGSFVKMTEGWGTLHHGDMQRQTSANIGHITAHSDFLTRGQYGNGTAANMPPLTGVNFIVYAGRSTAGINPVPGGEIAPRTTRMMIEKRLAQVGIGEEEIKMLKEQLEEIKRTEAA